MPTVSEAVPTPSQPRRRGSLVDCKAETAGENLELNEVPGSFSVVCADLVSQAGKTYDLVVANILAEPNENAKSMCLYGAISII